MHGEIKLPDTWPEPPREMSVSSLRAIESCPRRWALSTASYPDLWRRNGYPPRTRRSWLLGSVVHLAIERIIGRLAEADCGAVSDPCATAVIRELGGFTSILRSCIQDIVASQAENPRIPDIADLEISLEHQMSRMRVDVQSLLSSLSLVSADELLSSRSRRGVRGPLGPGTYAELEVRAPALRWKGFVDLLVIGSDSVCEIRDFKTGAHSDDHEFQIRAYSVLWSADPELNPAGNLATKLTISYPNGDVAVPAPTGDEVEGIKAELAQRTTVAMELTEASPPEARPDAATCRFCDVRHLCTAYWQTDTQRRFAEGPDAASLVGDLQVRVLSRRGPVTWDAEVQSSDRLEKDDLVVLLAHGSDHGIEEGAVLRILDARLLTPNTTELDEQPEVPLASLTSASEVYVVP